MKNNTSNSRVTNNKKRKSKFNFNKLITIIMLIATIALYLSTIVYAVVGK